MYVKQYNTDIKGHAKLSKQWSVNRNIIYISVCKQNSVNLQVR